MGCPGPRDHQAGGWNVLAQSPFSTPWDRPNAVRLTLLPRSNHTPVMGLPDICSHYEPFFILPDERLRALVKQFREELESGLSEYGKDVAMVPSFVMGVPDGSEQG